MAAGAGRRRRLYSHRRLAHGPRGGVPEATSERGRTPPRRTRPRGVSSCGSAPPSSRNAHHAPCRHLCPRIPRRVGAGTWRAGGPCASPWSECRCRRLRRCRRCRSSRAGRALVRWQRWWARHRRQRAFVGERRTRRRWAMCLQLCVGCPPPSWPKSAGGQRLARPPPPRTLFARGGGGRRRTTLMRRW